MSILRSVGECLYSKPEIDSRVRVLAANLTGLYADLRAEEVAVVPIMNGAMRFCSALLDHKLQVLTTLHPMRVKTYEGTRQAEAIQHLNDGYLGTVKLPQHILVVEDIIDTGATARAVCDYFSKRKHHVVLCSLLKKKHARMPDTNHTMIGFHCPDDFVVGYGLDYDGYLRDLQGVYIFNKEPVSV